MAGLHGAGMANAFFARPGSASERPPLQCCERGAACAAPLEWVSSGGLRPSPAASPGPQPHLAPTAVLEVFSAGWTWEVHRWWLDAEAAPQLQWWALTVEDPAALEPGEYELAMGGNPRLYQGVEGDEKRRRDQSVRVPWPGIDRLLQARGRGCQQLAGSSAQQLVGRRAAAGLACRVRCPPCLPCRTMQRCRRRAACRRTERGARPPSPCTMQWARAACCSPCPTRTHD